MTLRKKYFDYQTIEGYACLCQKMMCSSCQQKPCNDGYGGSHYNSVGNLYAANYDREASGNSENVRAGI